MPWMSKSEHYKEIRCNHDFDDTTNLEPVSMRERNVRAEKSKGKKTDLSVLAE